MTSWEIQTWNRCLEIAEEENISIEPGDKFRLSGPKKQALGCFETVSEVFAFLCGWVNGQAAVVDWVVSKARAGTKPGSASDKLVEDILGWADDTKVEENKTCH